MVVPSGFIGKIAVIFYHLFMKIYYTASYLHILLKVLMVQRLKMRVKQTRPLFTLGYWSNLEGERTS